jgi:hypothetical protein
MHIDVYDLPSSRGKRLTISDHGTETLRADVPNTAPYMTVYWHGRVDRNKLLSFFLEGCPPPVARREFSFLVYRPNDRLRLGGFNTVMALERNLPDDASFLRLEHTSADDPAPDFIVWARVDLQDVPPSEPASDYIGVAAQREQLTKISQRLGEFVSDTHVDKLPSQTACANVRSLLHYHL